MYRVAYVISIITIQLLALKRLKKQTLFTKCLRSFGLYISPPKEISIAYRLFFSFPGIHQSLSDNDNCFGIFFFFYVNDFEKQFGQNEIDLVCLRQLDLFIIGYTMKWLLSQMSVICTKKKQFKFDFLLIAKIL